MTPLARKVGMFLGGALTATAGFATIQQAHRDGYKDTPMLPGQPWHVHDSDRPYPHEVVPGAAFANPPSDAIVLFDGKDLSQWVQTDSGKEDGSALPPKWKVVDGCIQVEPGTGNLFTKDKFGACQLHFEWQESANVTGGGQGRGNSGLFIASRYEIQILDSYKAATYADGQAGAIYGQWPPLVNPQRKPGEWQTYDVTFEPPKFDGEKVVSPAYLTVFFNGVLVHNHQALNGPTDHGVVTPYDFKEGAEDRIYLQDHGAQQPLRFRNIWIRKLKGYDQP